MDVPIVSRGIFRAPVHEISEDGCCRAVRVLSKVYAPSKVDTEGGVEEKVRTAGWVANIGTHKPRLIGEVDDYRASYDGVYSMEGEEEVSVRVLPHSIQGAQPPTQIPDFTQGHIHGTPLGVVWSCVLSKWVVMAPCNLEPAWVRLGVVGKGELMDMPWKHQITFSNISKT